MNSSDKPKALLTPGRHETDAILTREAGLAFRPTLGPQPGVDPFDEWRSLMEVDQMLCPIWPVRDKPMQGSHWRL